MMVLSFLVGNLGDGPKRDESFLVDLAQRLKLVKESSFDALNPLRLFEKIPLRWR
jgi:hypothetical protein